MRIPFVGAGYKLSTIRADCQNSINWFVEIIESGTGSKGEKSVLLQVPGLRRVATVGTGPIRGLYATSSGRLAVVSGNQLYVVGPDWVATAVGTLNSYEGRVEMADNGLQIIVVDGASGYICNMLSNEFVQITSDGFPRANRVSYQDGYFICDSIGTNQFSISALYDGLTWNALDFGLAEGLPDPVVAVVANQRQLWVAGTKSMEVYWNSGDEFPFSRIDGSFQQFGCIAPHTFQKIAGTLCWLTDTKHVVMAEGFKPTRISTYAVELAILQAGDLSKASAYVYYQNGHIFYCLILPGTESTWCFDMTTKAWHERSELVNGAFIPSRVSCVEQIYNQVVAGDSTNGKIYVYDFDAFTNDGDLIYRERTTPHVNNNMDRLSITKFQLDIDGGHGLEIGYAASPKVMLQCSKDGGYTWGNEHWVSAGTIGGYRTRAIFRQLGQARDWVFRVVITDPVRAQLLGADVTAIPGAN